MSPFVTRITKRDQWVWPISGMCVVLGFMVAVAWITKSNRETRFDLLEPNQRQRVSEAAVDPDAFADMSAQIATQNKQITELQNTLAKGKGSTQLLNKQLQDAKAAGGLTKLEGPGVIVTLRDSSHSATEQGLPPELRDNNNIHDLDVIRIVNELIAAGAEAIAINDHRISGLTSIRCVGPTILINDVKIASPVMIKAVGDPGTMAGGLNLNDGVLSEIRSADPKMVSIEVAKTLSLPAFAGRTEFRLGESAEGGLELIAVPFLALLLGVVLALALKIPSAGGFTGQYLALASLAGLDTVLGGIRGGLEDRFESGIFISGFFVNIVIAFLLAILGDKIGVNLYLVVAFVFGNRIFTNLSLIRRSVVTKVKDELARRKRQTTLATSPSRDAPLKGVAVLDLGTSRVICPSSPHARGRPTSPRPCRSPLQGPSARRR